MTLAFKLIFELFIDDFHIAVLNQTTGNYRLHSNNLLNIPYAEGREDGQSQYLKRGCAIKGYTSTLLNR